MKELLRESSKIWANIKGTFYTCNKCDTTISFVRLKYINKNNIWEYQAVCRECGDTLFDSEGKR